ncbi:MAG: peptidylprolyl isomerase, partial [Acidimicrobiales bacterium]|nr:peptidylprolyl isomerase [Acidimicrobiales bacterium]
MVLLTVLGGCASEPTDDAGPEGTVAVGEDADVGAPADYGTGECAAADGVDEPILSFDDAPQQCIDLDAGYTATFATSKGDIVVELDTERAPIAVNNFVNLARAGYYDGTDLHRVVSSAGFVQGGSPHTQDAADPGPGYTIPDEGTYTAEDYVPGVLAMART